MNTIPRYVCRWIGLVLIVVQALSPGGLSLAQEREAIQRLATVEQLLQSARAASYRASVTLRYPRSLQLLHDIGATVLHTDEKSALVVASGGQLELLARKRFGPRQVIQVPGDLDAPGWMSISAADSDGDGLTDTEEGWWCTNPNNSDTDLDGYTDGYEVDRILAWNPIQGPPFVKWQAPDGSPIPDGDADSVPDLAEILAIGTNPDRESTDGDKFDDGQELFGITVYPDHGALPRPEDSFITANMPGWVDPPGDHVFVAAYPVISVDVIANSVTVELVTTITTGETHGIGESFTYGVAKTEGTSTTVGKTESHSVNSWQEVSNSIADEWERSHYEGTVQSASYQYSKGYTQGWHAEAEFGGHVDVTTGAQASANCQVSLGLDPVSCGAEVGVYGEVTTGASWALSGGIERQNSETNTYGYEVSRESGDTWGYTRVQEQTHTRGVGYETGYATTIERSSYQETTVTNDHTIASTQEWSTATAVDTQHAANLFFTYRVRNSGTDNARAISGIVFNVHIGNTVRTYYASQQDVGVLANFYPGESHTYTTSGIPLSLEQVRLIDEGAPMHIVVEDYGYGDDEQFYQNAWGMGVLVEMDDGVWDGIAEVEPYMIATWAEETYQEVIERYFGTREHRNGNITALTTPEYNIDHEIIAWNTHEVSGRSWWDIFHEDKNPLAATVTSFKEEPVWPETRVFLRFNQDTDGDRYSDRTELKLGTDPADPLSHPGSTLVAGYRKQVSGDKVAVTMSFLNLGNYDAVGVEAVMYAPDATVDVGNNLLGGGGRVRPGEWIVLGPTFNGPVLNPGMWNGDAEPMMSGLYTGSADQVYSFSVNGNGYVGISPGLTVGWSDGSGHNGTFNVGDGYAPPNRLALAEGVQIAFSSGYIQAGDVFTGGVRMPLDTMTYTINNYPYTEPVIVVSYNDAQGNHRFVTQAELPALDANLAPHANAMIYESALEIVPLTPFDPEGENLTRYIYYHPHAQTISDAHLFIEMATRSGDLVAETTITPTISGEMNTYSFQWNTGVFTVPYSTDEQYKIVAVLTDREGNIIDTDVQQFSDFGTRQQNWMLSRVMASGGGPKVSSSFQVNGTSGQGWATGVRASAHYQLWSGFWSGWIDTPYRHYLPVISRWW